MSKSQNHHLSADRSSLIDLLKRVAKYEKKANPAAKLSTYQDSLAVAFGYLNWSMLHKHVAQMSQPMFDSFASQVHAHPRIQQFVAVQPSNKEAAQDEMREWVRTHYTPLVEFAPLDNESETGFAFPDEDLLNDLQEEFDQQYPFDWIEEVAGEMEAEGPWGLPSRFDDYDDASEPEGNDTQGDYDDAWNQSPVGPAIL